MKPIGNKVIVRPAKRAAKTGGGIYIPERARDSASEGVVLALGRGFIHEKTGHLVEIDDIEVGDRVIYVKRKGQDVKMKDGTWRRILNYEDVLCVVEVEDSSNS